MNTEDMVQLSSIRMLAPGAAPVALKLAQIGGIGQTVDSLVKWDRSRCAISPGVLTETLVAALLCGSRPLYHVGSFWEERGCDPYFSRHGVGLEQLNDDAYGYLLDRIAEGDGQGIVESVALRLLAAHDLDVKLVHVDTTSISVEGAFEMSEEGERPEPSDERSSFVINHGYSKDHRPDLKQFKIGLGVQQDGMPLTGELLSGNTSDRVWNPDAVEHASRLLRDGGFGDAVFVADSALVARESLESLAEGGIDFISILPGTFSLERELKDEAWRQDAWTDLGALAEDPDGKSARYRCRQVVRELECGTFGFLVVHSTQLDGRKERALRKRFATFREEWAKEARTLAKRAFACEEDARRAVELLESQVRSCGLEVSGRIEKDEKILRGRGRPKKDVLPETSETWRCIVDVGEVTMDAYALSRRRESTFVLVYRLERNPDIRTPEQILKAYKNQNVVEQGFRFLKQPVYLGPVYLKTPSRVQALGYVFILVLLLSKYLEYRVRSILANEGKALVVGGQKAPRPTTKTILECLETITLLQAGSRRLLPNPLNENVAKIMRALGFSWELYTVGDCEDLFTRLKSKTA